MLNRAKHLTDDRGDPPSKSWHRTSSTSSSKTSEGHPDLEDHWLPFDLLLGVWTRHLSELWLPNAGIRLRKFSPIWTRQTPPSKRSPSCLIMSGYEDYSCIETKTTKKSKIKKQVKVNKIFEWLQDDRVFGPVVEPLKFVNIYAIDTLGMAAYLNRNLYSL